MSTAEPPFETQRADAATGTVDVPPVMDRDAIIAFLDAEFPQIHMAGRVLFVEDVAHRFARLRLEPNETMLRPGGTISGPTMFMLADVGFYVAVLASVGPQALAVTTNININFLRRPEARRLYADARLFKLGRRLAVGEVTLRLSGDDEPVAHATGTYSLPPRA